VGLKRVHHFCLQDKQLAENTRENGSGWNTLFNLFGFRLEDRKPSANTTLPTLPIHQQNPTFTPPLNDDGAVVLSGNGWRGVHIDLEGQPRNEVETITRYREMALQAEVESAINNICNEAIVRDNSGKCVDIVMDNLDVPEFIKDRIKEEFDEVLRLLNFGLYGPDLFRRWYIDGREYFHIIIDKDRPEKGIQELRYIDPRKIRKVREITRQYDHKSNLEIIVDVKEYYMYNERGILGVPTNLGTKIAPDSIIYVPSGLIEPKSNQVISYLQKAMKPLNQLRMVEDAMVIYRLARAPERRVFYIDVGNMPTVKANQYVTSIMQMYKNKLVYDANTGEIKDDRRMTSMLEDFWLPRREGSKGTEISTLPGGENLGRIEDIEYFQRKLYKSLDVPISRLEPQEGFTLGRSAEITRDELNFMKHVDSLRLKFSKIIDSALKTQLILKGVLNEEDWEEFSEHIYYDFLKDNNFTELKDQELWRSRFEMVTMIDPFLGKYVSAEWIRKEILKMTDDDIEEMEAQIEEEASNPRFINPMLNGGLGGGPMGLGGPEDGMGGPPGMGGPMGGPPGMPQPGMPPQQPQGPFNQKAPEMNSNMSGQPDTGAGNRFKGSNEGFIATKGKKKRIPKKGVKKKVPRTTK
jgi:hypothetical protein